jgi:hypothetical protein
MANTDSKNEIASGSVVEPELGPSPLLQTYSAKMIGTDCGLKRRLLKKKESRHGKFSSLRPVEQLLHAGRERHASVAAIGGSTLMFRAEPGTPPQGAPPQGQQISGRLCF